MNRIDRLVAIVLLLQSKRLIRAEDIADHFEISVRTVYRDINALCEAGVPVAGEAGVGYSLVAGYNLPPVMFTEEEASALIIGAEFVRQMTDDSLHKHVRSALLKIRAVLPNEKKEYIERLQSSIAVFTRPAAYQSEVRDDVMTTVQRAIVHRHVVTIEYSSRSESATTRDVEPLNLIYYGSNWHLIAYCRLRKDIRDFRADRIHGIHSYQEAFPIRPDYSLMNYLQQRYQLEKPLEVVVRFTATVARGLSQKYYYGFVEEVADTEHVTMRFIVPSLRWIGAWLMGFGASVRVLSPEPLCHFMHEESLRITALYAASQHLSASPVSVPFLN